MHVDFLSNVFSCRDADYAGGPMEYGAAPDFTVVLRQATRKRCVLRRKHVLVTSCIATASRIASLPGLLHASSEATAAQNPGRTNRGASSALQKQATVLRESHCENFG